MQTVGELALHGTLADTLGGTGGGTAVCGGGLAFLLSDMPGSGSNRFYQLEVTSAAVPEPGTLALMASALFMLFLTYSLLFPRSKPLYR